MLDDLLDVFDRDRRDDKGRPPRRRGLRGIIDRFTGDHDNDDRARHDDRRGMDGDTSYASRRRNRDAFDLDD